MRSKKDEEEGRKKSKTKTWKLFNWNCKSYCYSFSGQIMPNEHGKREREKSIKINK